MRYITENFKLIFDAVANRDAIIKLDRVRFTVITDRIIRMEYSTTNVFEDKPTQIFWHRNQPLPQFEVKKTDNKVEIQTKYLHLLFKASEGGFNSRTLSIKLLKTDTYWHYGDIDKENLKGTIRTLDGIDGPINLDNGLLSRSGWVVIDDTDSLIFSDNGWIKEREKVADYEDLYFFGYGNDFLSCLKDFTSIAGTVPLLPRWALGNWWSRYWHYTQEELISLMSDFKKHEIPLSVCIIDMDWHIVSIRDYLKRHSKENWEDIAFHSGWTGFSWNKDLFPNHKEMLNQFKDLKLKTALNLHPADGVYAYETGYKALATEMGMDPNKKEPIYFDISDPMFAKGYFEYIMHPLEEDGIDFWWVDWQQEKASRSLKKLDPLFWLNHLYFYDLARDKNKRPIIFSRYFGLGNQRYQIGFSGDTYSTWDSLHFQPYFTATASNVAYSWWSHDIGGHISGKGITDDELYLRWLQFGLFSPILRLHSTKNIFNERIPWKFDNENVFTIAKSVMNFRHLLIPYLYSMSWRNHHEKLPLIMPMYYLNPDIELAYHKPNQYYFGSELLVAPFIEPLDRNTGHCRQKVWLPSGTWFNFFTGEFFEGNKEYAIFGKMPLDEMPVFAKAGAIIPLTDPKGLSQENWNLLNNPDSLNVVIFPGKDNEFLLYEDDGESQEYLEGHYIITKFTQNWNDHELVLEKQIIYGKNHPDLLPTERILNFEFRGIEDPSNYIVSVDDKLIETEITYDSLMKILYIKDIKAKSMSTIKITLQNQEKTLISTESRELLKARKMIKYWDTTIEVKEYIYNNLPNFITSIKEVKAILDEFINSLYSDPKLFDKYEKYIKELEKNIATVIKIAFLDVLVGKGSKQSAFHQQLMHLMTKDPETIKSFFWRTIVQSRISQGIFGLSDAQIKSLIEICASITID
jgi:alpha-glucosidase (family GH31 glycosyl hydrolase)